MLEKRSRSWSEQQDLNLRAPFVKSQGDSDKGVRPAGTGGVYPGGDSDSGPPRHRFPSRTPTLRPTDPGIRGARFMPSLKRGDPLLVALRAADKKGGFDGVLGVLLRAPPASGKARERFERACDAPVTVGADRLLAALRAGRGGGR